MRYSSSHNEAEIEWLHQLLMTLNRGGDVGVLVQSEMMMVWLKKVVVLRNRTVGEPPPVEKPRPVPQEYESDFPHGNTRRPRVADSILPLGDEDEADL